MGEQKQITMFVFMNFMREDLMLIVKIKLIITNKI